jgi:predicted unusual protein kinase regulating ubiquinone biosynthesis (AarF/ABC1/UbiB family)
MADRFANTPGRRFLKLTGMTAKVAGKYTATRIRNHLTKNSEGKDEALAAMYAEVGEEVLQTLGEMKGAAMKVGQIASQLGHLLPPELAEKLARLQQQSPPVPYAVMADQVKRELGFPPEKLFRHFEQKPFAAASIGQVHRAVTRDGRKVVVKIQYPGVQQSCRSDLVQLKRLFSLAGLVKIDPEALDQLFLEIEQKLMEELDYQAEADNLREFRAFHSDFPQVVIPEVIEEYTTAQVLCLSDEPGDNIAALAGKGYSQTEINDLAQVLVAAMLREVLYHGRAHCDPHPGNFAFRKSGEVVIYDYGCVADIRDVVIDRYIDIVEAGLAGEFHRVDGLLVQLGLRDVDTPEVSAELYRQLFVDFVEPVLQETDLAVMTERIRDGVGRHVDTFLALRGRFRPSAATIFLNRVLTGHLLNLAQIGVDVDLKPVVLSHLFEE